MSDEFQADRIYEQAKGVLRIAYLPEDSVYAGKPFNRVRRYAENPELLNTLAYPTKVTVSAVSYFMIKDGVEKFEEAQSSNDSLGEWKAALQIDEALKVMEGLKINLLYTRKKKANLKLAAENHNSIS